MTAYAPVPWVSPLLYAPVLGGRERGHRQWPGQGDPADGDGAAGAQRGGREMSEEARRYAYWSWTTSG